MRGRETENERESLLSISFSLCMACLLSMPLVMLRQVEREGEGDREPSVYFCPSCFWIWHIHCE